MPFDTLGAASTVGPATGYAQRLAPATITAFSAPDSTGWEDKAGDRLAELMKLSPGWDGHQAPRVSRTVVDYACNLLPRLVTPGIPAPFIAPLAFGGLQLEWHRKGWDLEIEIHGPNQLYAYAREIGTGAEWERELADDLTELGAKLNAIRD